MKVYRFESIPLAIPIFLMETGIKNIDTSISSGSTDDGIPTSKAVSQYVKKAINSAITTALNTEV